LVGCTRVAREDGLGQSRYGQARLGRCNQLCLVTVFNQSLAPHVCLASWAVGHSLKATAEAPLFDPTVVSTGRA
jgi:hypothetical protein